MTSQENDMLTTKYGLIHSIRMPFAQDTRGASYFGFITMANAGIHEKLLKDLAEMRLIFGDMELMFEKAASRRSPYPPGKIGKTKRKWDSTEEEEVVVTSIRTDASVNLDEDHKVKDEPVEPNQSYRSRAQYKATGRRLTITRRQHRSRKRH